MGEFLALDAPFLAGVLWQSTLALAAAYALSLALRRHSARAHYFLALGLAASVVLPVAFVAAQHAGLGLFPAPLNVADAALPSTDSAQHDLSHAEHPSSASSAAWDWAPWMGGLWYCVSALLLLRLLVALGLGLRLLAKAKPLINERLHSFLEAAMRHVGIERTPIAFTTERVHCPAIWCWAIHPALLLPSTMVEDAGGDDAGRWTSVFSHELAHLKRRDHLAAIVAEAVSCLLWWHPLVWLCRQRLNALSDEACDQWVVASGQPVDMYAETLLDMIPQVRTLTALSMVSGKRGLKRRIAAILDATPAPPHAGRRWLLATTAATVLLVALAACMQTGAKGQSVASNMLVNADMEQGVDAPESWSQGGDVDGVAYLWDRSVARSGKSSLCLKKTVQRYFPIAGWMEEVGALKVPDGSKALRLKLDAWVKAENAYKAILDVQYTDAKGEWGHQWAAFIGAKEIGDPPANHDWKLYGGEVDIPAGVTGITVAFQIYGPGTVWFDDVSLAIAGVGEKSDAPQPKVGFDR